jgi:flagellar basal-body rod protein FlgB
MAGIFGKEFSELASVMNFRLFRQGIISSNIANIDTPGYKSRESAFEEELDSRIIMSTTSPEHIPSPYSAETVSYKVAEDPFARIGNDSNTVDLDREMMKLNQNQLLYEASADAVQTKITALKEAIRGIK